MICVDASVAAMWVLDEPESDRAAALYDDALTRGEAVIAPPLLPIEVTNIVRQRVRRTLLTPAVAQRALAEFLTFPIALVALPNANLTALQLANHHDLPAAYDAFYLGIAQALDVPLWTNDQRLLRRVRGMFPFVRWIGEYGG